MSGLTEIAVDAARKRHPRIELVFETLDATEEVRAPKLAFACFKTKRLERDRDLHSVAGLVDDPFRLHQQVDAEVFAAAFSKNAVCLNTERIEESLERFSFVVESVEKEADVIVLE